MRIILVIRSFNMIGGVRETVHHLALELARQQHTVAVISHHSNIDEANRRSLAIERAATGFELMPVTLKWNKPVTWRHPERIFRAMLGPSTGDLTRMVRDWRPDVVSVHGGDSRAAQVAAACKAASVPVVFCISGRARMKPAEMRAARCDSYVAVSQAVKTDLVKLVPEARDATVIAGGVDWEIIQSAAAMPRARPYLLCVCRLDLQNKAVDTLIASFLRIAREYPNLDLLIAGDGPDRGRLERDRDAAGLSGRVQFLGQMPQHQLWPLYKGAEFFAMPSRRAEGLGMIFLEAMAAGKAVIGTRLGGVKEVIINGQNGFLIDEDDRDGLAAALARLAGDLEVRNAMGARGREMARAYAWPEFARRYAQVFERVAKSPDQKSTSI